MPLKSCPPFWHWPAGKGDLDPVRYQAWYHTRRGQWIAGRETRLLQRLLRPAAGATLLDVGTGTGQFARQFTALGLAVTGLDPDVAMLRTARALDSSIAYLSGEALHLPFPDASFDYCMAVTSLCFVGDPRAALVEMWRVARRGVALGLLNRHSLLHRQKAGRNGYRGARWDTAADVRAWAEILAPAAVPLIHTGLTLSQGGPFSRLADTLLPSHFPWGGFLAAILHKPL